MNKDLIEEQSAAKTIIGHLAGKPILNTSGDENHRLNPKTVEFRVGLTENGDELAIIIAQGDRHHPHLVYDTMKSQLENLPELAGYNVAPLDPEKDYDPQTGKIIMRYEIGKGEADSIIHKLSEKSDNIEKNNIGSAISQVIEYFSAGNSSAQIR